MASNENISETIFPSSFVPTEDKSSKEYLLKYSETLWQEAQKEVKSFSFNSRKERMKSNREYSEGLQSIEKFKQQFSTTGDNTYLNFDWGVSNPLPKFVEIFRAQMINQPYKPDFKPVDSLSLTEYDIQKKILRAKLELKKELAPLIQRGEIPDFKDVPEDNDELEIMVQTNFKLAQSIALETITDAILEDNDIEYIQTHIAKDLIDNKIGAAWVGLDENKNIVVEYIDPVRLVTSVVKKDNFSDAKHIGRLIDMTIEDLRVKAAGQLSEEDLFEIAKSVAGKYDNMAWTDLGQYYQNPLTYQSIKNFNVLVLDYEMFSTDDFTVTKVEATNGGYKTLINEEPRNKKAKKTTSVKKIKNVYCCKYIVGTKHVFDYGLKPHIIRDRLNQKYSTNTTLGFIVYAPDIYDMENKSKVEEMIPYADELIRIQLKMQQLYMKAAPSGYAINVDAVVEGLAAMGIGGMKPIDARAMRDQIGDIYYRAVREDGSPVMPQGGLPITPLPNGLDNSLIILIEAYNATLARMKEVVGMNDAVDSSQPDKKALIGVQKLAAAAHKNAMRTLNNAYLKINEDIVRQVSLLSQQLIRQGINKDKFINMVGKEIVDQIDITKVASSDFAISIKMLPDEEEKAYIENKVEIALMSQPPMINLQDAFAIRRVANEDVDKAEQLLAIREKRRKKEQQELSRQMQQENAALQTQVAQASEQARAQTEQIKLQLEMQQEQAKKDLELRNAIQLEDEKRKTMALEYEYKKELVELAAETDKDKISHQKSEESSYDKLNMPKASGSTMPQVTPTVKPQVQIK